MRTRRTHTKAATGQRRWAVAALTAFLILDAVLVGWAFVESRQLPSSTNNSSPQEPEIPAQSETAGGFDAPTPSDLEEAVPAKRVLDAYDSNTAWRSKVGSCPSKPPVPEFTTDGGKDWEKSNLNDATGAASILAIRTLSESVAEMLTLANKDCEPEFVKTFVGGDDWTTDHDRLGSAWFVDPSDRGVVHTREGNRKAPCRTAVALAAEKDTAAILCSDYRVFRTTSAGTKWGEPIDVPDAAVLASSEDGYVVAVANDDSCAGIQLYTLPKSGKASVERSGKCRKATFKPGDLAISEADGTIWLWAGKQLSQTDDHGATWQ
ncbi:hypothetical protein LWF01_19185 [Saxibacter everestensis]|uniref:Secreted protein n=1 Tax=Saxibacter everestensis TaxID=2909229 RepID=A0ABY8QVD9_9MICO|nr:hypothetical protein LWF01_19185 [Brevibacteriaceae bacterium ZFBP1038]